MVVDMNIPNISYRLHVLYWTQFIYQINSCEFYSYILTNMASIF